MCILRYQAETRSNIIGEGTSFDAQKQFLANKEDSINSAVDLSSSIKRYQDALKYMYAGSKVDYVIGLGLYILLPSDFQLRIGTISIYNNNIVIADPQFHIGYNPTINTVNTVSIVNTANNEPLSSPPLSPPLPSLPNLPDIDHGVSRLALTGGLLFAGLIGIYFK